MRASDDNSDTIMISSNIGSMMADATAAVPPAAVAVEATVKVMILWYDSSERHIIETLELSTILCTPTVVVTVTIGIVIEAVQVSMILNAVLLTIVSVEVTVKVVTAWVTVIEAVQVSLTLNAVLLTIVQLSTTLDAVPPAALAVVVTVKVVTVMLLW